MSHSKWGEWVLVVTFGEPYCFCPIEKDGAVVVGLSIITDKCPGKLVGVLHEDGEDAVNSWVKENPNWRDAYSKTEAHRPRPTKDNTQGGR